MDCIASYCCIILYYYTVLYCVYLLHSLTLSASAKLLRMSLMWLPMLSRHSRVWSNCSASDCDASGSPRCFRERFTVLIRSLHCRHIHTVTHRGASENASRFSYDAYTADTHTQLHTEVLQRTLHGSHTILTLQTHTQLHTEVLQRTLHGSHTILTLQTHTHSYTPRCFSERFTVLIRSLHCRHIHTVTHRGASANASRFSYDPYTADTYTVTHPRCFRDCRHIHTVTHPRWFRERFTVLIRSLHCRHTQLYTPISPTDKRVLIL